MPPSQGNNPNFGAQMSTRVPSGVKSATSRYADQLHASDAIQNIGISDVLRVGLSNFLLERWDDIPADVREDLDREYLEGEVENMPRVSGESS